MRDCHDSLLSAAAVAANSAYGRSAASPIFHFLRIIIIIIIETFLSYRILRVLGRFGLLPSGENRLA